MFGRGHGRGPAGQQAVPSAAWTPPPVPVGPSAEVIVIWDIENCPVPDNLTIMEVVT